jgi:hypothetical protein|tara:strand:+ start:5985 stop:6431 length:447 start_codon:yes stop_codon:yes gene_type:complete
MRRISSSDLKQLNLLKHYRIIRKWACKTCDIKEADLELLIYLEAIDLFTKDDFKKGTYSYSWDNRRWNRLLKQGWITVWRKRNRTTQKYHIYKVSTKCKQLISRMYRIMLGEEDMPNKIFEKNDRYIYKVLNTSILNVNKDKTRNNGL